MTAFEIILIIAGAGLFAVSFFITEKLSSSDVEYIQKLSEKEVKVILDRELASANDVIDDRLHEKTEDAVAEIERATDRDTNDKLLSMNEFSDTVLGSMNKSHDEIMFLYSMLNDKQTKIDEMTRDMKELEKKLTGMKASLDGQMKKLDDEKLALEQQKRDEEAEDKRRQEKQEAETRVREDVASLREAFQNRLSEEESEGEKKKADGGKPLKEEILALKEKGLSEVEIAKKLGCGIGEVRLTLGRFFSPEAATEPVASKGKATEEQGT